MPRNGSTDTPDIWRPVDQTVTFPDGRATHGSLKKRMLPTMGFTSIPPRRQKGKISWIIGQKPDILSILTCWLINRDSSSGPNFLTCDLGRKLFGQVSHYLEMNKMHLIEKTFIRNRFEVHGRGRWADTDVRANKGRKLYRSVRYIDWPQTFVVF